MVRRALFASTLLLLTACGADEPNGALAAPADASAIDAADVLAPDVLPEPSTDTADATSDAIDAADAPDAPWDGPSSADCRRSNYCAPTSTPACDPATGHCVECIDNSTCTGNTGACNLAKKVCTCVAGLTECETPWAAPRIRMCVDVTWAGQACGDCLHSCNGSEWCQSGACKCKPGYTPCGDFCTDLQTDIDHCGGCAAACVDGERCEAGSCKTGTTCSDAALTTCPMGQRAGCADTKTSPTNCGACGRPCEGPTVCLESDCKRGWPATGCAACPCDPCGQNPFTNASVAAPRCLPPLATGAPPQCVE